MVQNSYSPFTRNSDILEVALQNIATLYSHIATEVGRLLENHIGGEAS